MATPEKIFENASEQVSKQFDQVMGIVNFWQTQTQKAVDLWMDHSLTAAKESQKLFKDWMATGNQASSEFCKAVETNWKDAIRMFGPQATKSGKA